MFWGLIMEPGRCYTQEVKISFHVSMAAIDITNASVYPTQVMCLFEGRNYLLCTLDKTDKLQVPLDLNFEVGSKVSFATNGESHVHLTGYLTGLDDDEEDAELDEEEEEDDQVEVKVEPTVDKKRRKSIENAAVSPLKRTRLNKSPTVTSTLQNNEDEDDDDSSDSDFDINKALDGDEDEDVFEEVEEEEVEDAEEENGEEEEEDEENNEEEEDVEDENAEEEEVDEDESDEGEEEEVVQEEKPKQNGIAKKMKKNKQVEVVEVKAPSKKAQKQAQKTQKSGKNVKKQVLRGGILIEDLKEGAGDPAKSGKVVQVYYEGKLKSNNKIFDSSTRGPGFSFRLGRGEVIKGWDLGLVGMKVGGKRRITCPPAVAYGSKGSPPVIPPNSTLVFEVELKKIS